VREARNQHRVTILGFGAAAWILMRLCRTIAARPIDAVAVVLAGAITTVIVVNAVFLQASSRPAPFIATPRAQPRMADMTTTQSAPASQALQPVPLPPPAPVRRNDPIAELIGPSARIRAVQRVLSEYGYGQIKPSGMLDDATSMAIERFEREHKLPVNGRVSDRLIGALSAMTGHPVE